MNSQDPRTNPNTSPIFSSEVNQPYARRSVSFFFWLIAIIVGGAFFSGFLFSYDSSSSNKNTAGNQQVSQQMTTAQTSGNSRENAGATNSVYNFFYTVFSGIQDGLADHPSNLKNTGHAQPESTQNAAPALLQPAAGHTTPQLNNTYFDGKILDYEGHVAGDISAVKYDDGEIKSFNFILKEALTPPEQNRTYSIPEDQVKVVQEGEIFFIQLNKEQTEGLAEKLYEKEK